MSESPRDRIAASLAQRVSSGLHLGLLRYGQRLPSTRAVALEFSVDPRVALAAYRELERRGLVELRTRSGIYVANPHAGDGFVHPPRDAWMIDIMSDSISHGIPATQLAERIRRSLETLRLRAVVLECNDDQLCSVSSELENDYGLEVSVIDLDDMNRDSLSKMRGADCVITTGTHAEVARNFADDLGVPALIVSMCDDLFAEVHRLLPAGPVTFVVSDTRFEAKLRRIFENDESSENLRTLVHSRDDLSRIPANSPTYLTRLTRNQIDAIPLLERVIPETSVFSPTTAREILEFVVRANAAASEVRPSAGRAAKRMAG
ncbi:MAG: GntR family transcriptional regulator [Gemmatimonadales bacterium]